MSSARLSARVTASSTYVMVNSSSARTSRRHRTVNVFPRKLCAQLGAHAWFIAAALGKTPTPYGRDSSSHSAWQLNESRATSFATASGVSSGSKFRVSSGSVTGASAFRRTLSAERLVCKKFVPASRASRNAAAAAPARANLALSSSATASQWCTSARTLSYPSS